MLRRARRSSALKASLPASRRRLARPRRRVHGLGEVGQHLLRLGAVAVQGVERLERRLRCRRATAARAGRRCGRGRRGPACRARVAAVTMPVAHGDGLVEQRQPVAHRAFGGAGDQRQRLGLGSRALAGDDLAEVRDQLRHVDAAQVEALAARQHGHRHLADLGGGEDELDVPRRLFQRLQQRVERALREHVHFVDDVDLVARHRSGA